MDNFGLVRYSGIPTSEELLVNGLTTLRIGSINENSGHEWAAKLMARNRRTLRRLQIGNEPAVAKMYSGVFPSEDAAILVDGAFAKAILGDGPFEHEQTQSQEFMKLEEVEFCWLHLSPILDPSVAGKIGQAIDWGCVSILSLQSCVGLTAAFGLLSNVKHNMKNLKSLYLRHEDGGSEFQHGVEKFLISLPPLQDLHILVFGSSWLQEIEPILKVHGPTLKTFSFDEIAGDAHRMFPSDLGHLVTVSQHCPRLMALGFSWDWSACFPPAGFKDILAWEWSGALSAPNGEAVRRCFNRCMSLALTLCSSEKL